MGFPAKIVVVEDDARMARAIERHLGRDGHDVTTVANGAALRKLYRQEGVDLVLLDLNLGSEDGMDLARELLNTTTAVVIIVSGRHDVRDRIMGLDAGADDYVTKPFAPDELRARVRAALRRHFLFMPDQPLVRAGPYSLDSLGLTLSRDGSDLRVRFTETQTRILRLLMQHHGQALSRDSLVSRRVNGTEDRSVDVHVANIRRRLRNAGVDELAIGPMRGLGYRLVVTCA